MHNENLPPEDEKSPDEDRMKEIAKEMIEKEKTRKLIANWIAAALLWSLLFLLRSCMG